MIGIMGLDLPFTFEAQPTERQLAAAVRHVSRRGLLIARSLGALLMLGGVVLLVLPVATGSLAAVYLVLGLAFGLLRPYVSMRRAIRNNMRLVGRPTTYQIDAGGIRTSSELSEGVFRWPLISAIDELPDLIVVRVSKAHFVLLPVAALPRERRAALATFLRESVAAAAAPIPPEPTPAQAVPAGPHRAPGTVRPPVP
jgi:YcxB-like protein